MLDAAIFGIENLYLLTTTAADYFERRGFTRIERSQVPERLRATAEFQGTCPASATVMKAALARSTRGPADDSSNRTEQARTSRPVRPAFNRHSP